jgi:hypothetical protein
MALDLDGYANKVCDTGVLEGSKHTDVDLQIEMEDAEKRGTN